MLVEQVNSSSPRPVLPSMKQFVLDGFQSDNDPSDLPFYIEMNDLSMCPIKKCQSLYSTEDEVKMGFVFLLINIYDGTTR